MGSHRVRLLLFLFLAAASSAFSNIYDDRAALLRFRAAVRGSTIRYWNTTDAAPCLWEGVTCDSSIDRVTAVHLPGDGLVGELPAGTIGNLTELRALSLRGNAISGPLPSDLGLCAQLRDLSLHGNRFSGHIPESLFGLTNLTRLNLARNNFSGVLPTGFNKLTNLRILFLENNDFVGSLPDFVTLRQFNVSFNGFTGAIPSSLQNFSTQSFLGTSLCGGPLVSCPDSGEDGSNLSGGQVAGFVIGSAVGLTLFLIFSFLLWKKRSSKKASVPVVERSPVPPFPIKPPEYESSNTKPITVHENEDIGFNEPFSEQQHPPPPNGKQKTVTDDDGNEGFVFFGGGTSGFTLSELLKCSAEVLGRGTIGSTYKVHLLDGAHVTVKRLRSVSVSESEFRGKMEELGSIIHENLMPPRGYFYGKEEKILVYEPMPFGSLHALLHGNNKKTLSWQVRSSIALDAARGIECLHSVGPSTTHGNIKSSNIFLADSYKALVSEFGLMHVCSSAHSMNGYQAPEVTDSAKISQPADVYSFGVILLELLTRRSPDDALAEEGIDLPVLVRSVGQEKWTAQVIDAELVQRENREEKMVRLLHLAVACTSPQPEKRPSMAEISRWITERC